MSDNPAGDATALVIKRLSQAFAHLSPETVGAVVGDVSTSFRDARVATFLPILVERAAADRLRAIPSPRDPGTI